MATLGLMASWASALFGGWALVGGLAADTPTHPIRRSAERALIASAVAALIATGALLVVLVTGDVTINYVARSISTNLDTPYRVVALWNLPAGAVLPAAALVAATGWLVDRRATSALGTASTGAIVVALCAASLAAAPFSILPWRPTDGLGLSPELQRPLSVVGVVALTLAVAGAAALVARAADHLARDPRAARSGAIATGAVGREARADGADGAAPMILTLALLALCMWATARGSFEAGGTPSPSPLVARHGALGASLAALVLAWRARRGGAAAAFAGALGALGVLSAVLLGALPRPGGGWAVAAFAMVSLGAATVGAVVAALGERGIVTRGLGVTASLVLGAAGAVTLWLTDTGGSGMNVPAQMLLIGGGLAVVATEASADLARERWMQWPTLAMLFVAGALALAMAPSSAPSHALAIGWSLLAGASAGTAISRLLHPPASGDRVRGPILALAVALAALGAAGEGWARLSVTTLAGGATATVAAPLGAPFSLAHQGISRYEDGNAHVEALALEASRSDRPLALLSTDRREYVDSRDELLGPANRRPALLTTPLQELRVRLDEVGADEGATLRLAVVPFTLAWVGALACLVVLSATLLVPGMARRSLLASSDIASA